MNILLSAWPLLLWSGLAATLVAAWIVAPALGIQPRRALAPPDLGSFAFIVTLLLLPVLYGVAFELLQRASLLTGAGLGTLHAILMEVTRRRAGPRNSHALARAFVLIVYGATLGFTYVTP